MDIPWITPQCILCLTKGSLSVEHLIPASIGGSLTARFLCPACNSNLGRIVEKEAKDDPSIRIALENLKNEIPNLYSAITENQLFTAHSKACAIIGSFKKEDFRVRGKKLSDGSIVLPTEEAKKAINSILSKQGYDNHKIEEVLNKFETMPGNKISSIHPGLEASKWDIEKIEIAFSKTKMLNPLVPFKIAYEFLACHLGQAIYANEPELEEIRSALTRQDAKGSSFQIDRLNADKYRPFHGIGFEGNSPWAQVQIRLFGWLAFRVHFKRLKVHGPRFVYTHFLDKGYEDLRIIEDKM